MSDVFCPIPWFHIMTKTNGDIHGCCHMSQGPDRGLYTKDDGTPFNANNDKPTNAINSSKAKEIRRYIIEGNKHPECKKCWDEESSGIFSRRLQKINEFENKDLYEKNNVLSNTNSDGTINNPTIIDYEIRLGNFCNLKCRMCSPKESSKWYNDFYELTGKTSFKDNTKRNIMVKDDKGNFTLQDDEYSWFKENHFWNDLKENISNIYNIQFAGGEPTLIDEMYCFLQELVESDYAKNISIEYNINATFLPNKLFNLWKHFNEVKIGLSVDGVGSVNDYIRFPSNWKNIENNIIKLNNNMTDNMIVWFNPTIQALNVLYFPEFIQWKVLNNINNINKIDNQTPLSTVNMLTNPKDFSIKILPYELKQKVEKKYNNLVSWLNNNLTNDNYREVKIKNTENTLSGIVKHMYSEDRYDLIKSFIDKNTKLDELRKQNFSSVFPEMYNSMNFYT